MTFRRLPLAVVLLLVPLAACGGGDGDGGGGGGGGGCLVGPGPNYGAFVQNPTVAEANLAADVLVLVNNERAANGVPALAGHAPSAKVAFDFAVDMETRVFFDHLNPECEDPGVRLTRAGIGFSTWAENIALGQTTAAQVMTAWMASAPHRANILNPALTRLGVGVRQAVAGTYWVQVFSAP